MPKPMLGFAVECLNGIAMSLHLEDTYLAIKLEKMFSFTLIYFNLSTSICKICIIITRAHVMVLATIECVLPMKSDIIDHCILSILCRFIVTTIASA